MDLRQLEYVLLIAEEHNLTRAAERAFISQPALSHFITNLEENLGFQLFIRTKKIGCPHQPVKFI